MNFKEFKKLKIQYNKFNIEEYKEKNVIKVRDKRTILNGENIYEVYPAANDSKRVYVVCPYCGEIHIHGYTEDTIPGYRSPFCTLDNSIERKSYYINTL